MDDLISRSQLLVAYDKEHHGTPGRARALILTAPSGVIACRDCKHHDADGFCWGHGYPLHLVPEDGYCYAGAKEEP